MWKPTLVLLVTTLFVSAIAKSPERQEQTTPNAKVAGELKYKTPAGWVVDKPSSTMRVAQYKLPKAIGDAEDGVLVLYYFGERQGGTVQANMDRWIGQMQQPDGSSSKDRSKSEALTINGLKVTTVDVSGTYVAETAPGSGSFTNNPGYRLRAAVIETPKGSYYAKLVGPAKTIAQWADSFTAYLNSFEFK
jgi:hypothetical protein